jgi:hypothetical protein
MCCDHLVCASCSRPVADACCAVCRASRAQLHGSEPLSLAVFVAVLAVLLLLAVVLSVHF